MTNQTPPAPQTIQALISGRRGRMTYDQLAENSGGTVNKSTWQRMAIRGFLRAPEVETVKGIARALRANDLTVWLAIGNTIGLDLGQADGESRLLTHMPLGTGHLTDSQADLILGLITEMIDLRTAASGLAATPVRKLRSARRTTGHEDRGPRGGTR